MREGIADIVLEEGHKQRIHDGDAERSYAGEKNAKLLAQSRAALSMFRTIISLALHPACIRLRPEFRHPVNNSSCSIVKGIID